jgi:hypothetical protein
VLPHLDVIVVELEHYYVLALDLEGSLKVDHPSCVYEGLALDRITREMFQELLAVLYVLIIDHSVRF